MKILFDFLKERGLFERYEINVMRAIELHLPGITREELYARIAKQHPYKYLMSSFDFAETKEKEDFWIQVTRDYITYVVKRNQKERLLTQLN